MRMVTASRGPRPCSPHTWLLLIPFAVTLSATTVAAQDRVVLFDQPHRTSDGFPLPFELREFEIRDGGRRWSLLRTVEFPGHSPGTPVLLADNSRILWLAYSEGSAVLVQYELATGRASIVNTGPFDGSAVLVADPYALRVIIVESTRIIFVDQRLQPYSVALSSLVRSPATIAVADGFVIVQRDTGNAVEAVVVNSQTAEIVRRIPLPSGGLMRATRDASRLYRAPGRLLEMRDLSTGQLLAQVGTDDSVDMLEIDESRGVVIHTDRAPNTDKVIVGRDSRSLTPLGQLGLAFGPRIQFQLRHTRNENAILVYSTGVATTTAGRCEDRGPRIDVFDGRTSAFVTRIDLQRRCTTVFAIPPR